MATAQASSGEVGLVQRFAVEPHLMGRSVEMPPEGERKVEGVAEIDHAVEGEIQLVVLQELKRRRMADGRQAGQVDPGGIEMAKGRVRRRTGRWRTRLAVYQEVLSPVSAGDL